jgi:16S rRNA (uracil1498-N3)-methyltransferase
VLRLKPGDEIRVTDGQGSFYQCIISDSRNGVCVFRIKDKQAIPRPPYSIHIAVAPTKNHDRIEWLVEKGTEIGVDRITFMVCEHSERRNVNLERLQKMVVSAMKQSLKAWLPLIDPLLRFDNVLNEPADHKFIACLDEASPVSLFDQAKPGGRSLVLIGPEGDFTSQELASAEQAHFQRVALGNHRLRTETAALVAATTLALVNR